MKKRIRQFCRAVFARELSDEERAFAAEYLTEVETVFFFSMDCIDQKHALAVAKTILEKASQYNAQDIVFLCRLALLHDIGRRKGDLGIWGKVLAVLLDAVCPRWAKKQAEKNASWMQHALYVYYRHPEIAARMLRGIGCEEEAAIIARHHAPETPQDSLELRLLRMADEAN
ncbi:HD domain-containing protein [Selenomonas sp. TAMA-11512]|uniref:HD domain-containing protein n=1 Tax=Selenomonas sp. TAMA-11512 TaxID=3095337 RepID=UPI00308E3C2A|nr:HD domain-containing protein [Selenomonas sp. TAMA-11512]